MKSLKMIKLHIHYVFSKRNIILMGGVLLIFVVLFIFSLHALDPLPVRDANRVGIRMEYHQNMVLSVKMLTTLLVCYLFGIAFLRCNDNYHVFCLSNSVSRSLYSLTKILAVSLVFVLFLAIVSGMYMMIGLVVTNWFIVDRDILVFFSLMILQGIVFGLLTCILTIILQSLFVGLISFGIFIVNEILIEGVYEREDMNPLVFLLRILFPNVIVKNFEATMLFGTIHAIVVIATLVMVVLIAYNRKDLG